MDTGKKTVGLFEDLGGSARKIVGSIGDVFKPGTSTNSATAKAIHEAGYKPGVFEKVGNFFKGVGGGVGKWGVVKPIEASAKTALWVAERPIVFAIDVVRAGVRGIGGAYAKFPKTSWGLTAIAGGTAIGAWLGHRAETKTNAYYQAQAANLQTTAVANSYMNSASADEVAAMDARMKQGGSNASFADAAQQRAAAAQNAAAV